MTDNAKKKKKKKAIGYKNESKVFFWKKLTDIK